MEKVKLKHIAAIIMLLKLSIIAYMVYMFVNTDVALLSEGWEREFMFFAIAGFIAQIIDGALGMAYGVTSTSILTSFGVPQAIISASVHTAEVFTTGVSGLSHLYMRNIDKRLFIRLVITGVMGAVIGAVLLSNVIDGNVIKPYISAYLFILGVLIIIKSFRTVTPKLINYKFVPFLGFIGAFCDAIGGGGWGPIVTSNLIDKGKSPKEIIGTVNTAEFFVTFFCTGVFIFLVGIKAWLCVLGLIIGGIIAAPIGVVIIKFIPPKTLLRLVGLLIIITSSYNIYKVLA
jgi:uncharacterized membrane protein YfcA